MASSVDLICIDNNGTKVTLSYGKSFIGRGPLLCCADKRVSRKHAEINIDDDSVTITPLHVNPCFYQAKDETAWEELAKNEPKILENGDKFSFLRNSFTFEVRIPKTSSNEDKSKSEVNEETCNNKTEEKDADQDAVKPSTSVISLDKNTEGVMQRNDVVRKRILPKWLIEAAKKPALDNDSKEEQQPSKNRSKTVNKKVKNSEDNEVGSSVPKQNKGKTRNKKEERPDNTDDDQESNTQKPKKLKRIENNNKVEEEEKDDSVAVNKKNQSKKKRKSCQYGKNCYRKNTLHFEEFSHPGDWDYNSDPETNDGSEDEADDDRPECEYGRACYRKNPQHWKEYKHSKRPQRNAAKKARAKTRYDDDDDSDEFDDSFIDDDSDDYDPKRDYSSEEDLEELKRDAVAFQKNKKLIKPV